MLFGENNPAYLAGYGNFLQHPIYRIRAGIGNGLFERPVVSQKLESFKFKDLELLFS
jgi:hypothetical protein